MSRGHRTAAAWLAMAAFLCTPGAARAAGEPKPLVTLSLSQAEVELGRPFFAYVEVSVTPGAGRRRGSAARAPGKAGDVTLPAHLDLGPSVRELGRTLTVSRHKDRKLYAFELRLMAFDVGELEIPEIPILYAASAGAGEVRTAVTRISVVADHLPDDATLRELLPVPVIRRSYDLFLWIGGGLAGALVLATLAVVVARSTRNRRLERAHRAVDPAVHARARFDRLARDGTLDAPRQAYVAMSEVVREYVGDVFGVPALDATTLEISDALAQADTLPGSLRKTLIDWLRDADLVKFAGFEASAEDAGVALGTIRDWVDAADRAHHKAVDRA